MLQEHELIKEQLPHTANNNYKSKQTLPMPSLLPQCSPHMTSILQNNGVLLPQCLQISPAG
jgi:hypothetical protein